MIISDSLNSVFLFTEPYALLLTGTSVKVLAFYTRRNNDRKVITPTPYGDNDGGKYSQ